MAEVNGTEKLVPLLAIMAVSLTLLATTISSPNDTASGLVSPSSVGPRELKLLTIKGSYFAEPIAATYLSQAGLIMVSAPGPSFPAAAMTHIPRSIAARQAIRSGL